MRVLVTGGAGFIGSAVIRWAIQHSDHEIINVDKLTYAGNLESLRELENSDCYYFRKVDICDREALVKVFDEFRPDGVMHLAAESHVDRSIDDSSDFVQTNVVGTHTLLEVSKRYWQSLDSAARHRFRFHHVSTDEVYGALDDQGYFTEQTPYRPNSPYSASKAGSDFLVRAWFHTYQFPSITSNCSNNYGPFQFPEKLIPLMILNALDEKALPVYGKGENVRDWLYVDDHARCLWEIFAKGVPGETYIVGGRSERTNLEVVNTICEVLDELQPSSNLDSYKSLISFVMDRPGHDFRYAVDCSKVENELAWQPRESFESGIRKTVQWYIDHRDGWCRRVQNGSYRRERLGNNL